MGGNRVCAGKRKISQNILSRSEELKDVCPKGGMVRVISQEDFQWLMEA